MKTFVIVILILIAIKSITIGSSFNIHKWLKSPKEYWKKYNEWQSKAP